VFEAVYELPYLAHAPMEPLDAVARMGPDGCDVWTGSQFPTIDRIAAAKAAGIHRVRIHTLLAGGSFGRRATPNGDVAAEAAAVARAIDDPRPVKVVWTREDDIQGGRYRPLYVHRVRAALDARGRIVGWEHRIVGQSILKESWLTDLKVLLLERNIDPTSVEGAVELPYAVPNVSIELHRADRDVRVPVLWWRSVGHTHNAFVTETFLDECLVAAGRDPLAGRLELLRLKPRHRATLLLAATRAGWDESAARWTEPLPPGRARGIAVHESFKTVVAQIAEVSRRGDGLPKVERVVCAVDCGRVINPDVVRAQMEGGIGFGLGAALWNEITIERGRVKESNFHDYRPLRMPDMPAVEVHLVPSDAAPTGVGEPGVPPIAPAVANALAALTGQRVRRLPFARLAPAGTRTT
jgi:isoquinoline 1-oxidoreductase beta subunit